MPYRYFHSPDYHRCTVPRSDNSLSTDFAMILCRYGRLASWADSAMEISVKAKGLGNLCISRARSGSTSTVSRVRSGVTLVMVLPLSIDIGDSTFPGRAFSPAQVSALITNPVSIGVELANLSPTTHAWSAFSLSFCIFSRDSSLLMRILETTLSLYPDQVSLIGSDQLK